jgi:tRNA(Ile)-lysidine synthase
MSLKNLSVKIKIPKLLKDKLNNKRIEKIYKKFEGSLKINENFAVAVSGGPDSLALAFLAKIFSIKKKLRGKFYIIDHKLRPESTREAKLVKNLLKKFLINAEILTWRGKKPSKNVQSIARTNRYKLLYAKCEKLKIKKILLGHHQDDLLENFFIRIVRGSGLKGLISLDKDNKVGNKNLLRPLLYQKKEDLIFLAKNIYQFYINDPSNKNEKFQRIRIRKLIKGLQDDGLNKIKFLKTINNLKHSNNVVNFYVNENLQKNTSYSIGNDQLFLNREFFKQPYEVVFRALSESIKLIGKKYYPVRGKKLDKVISNLENNQSFRGTLGSCIIEKVNQTVIISKEQ